MNAFCFCKFEEWKGVWWPVKSFCIVSEWLVENILRLRKCGSGWFRGRNVWREIYFLNVEIRLKQNITELSWTSCAFEGLSWAFASSREISWDFVSFSELSWAFVSFFAVFWRFLGFHELLGSFMSFRDLSWAFGSFHEMSWPSRGWRTWKIHYKNTERTPIVWVYLPLQEHRRSASPLMTVSWAVMSFRELSWAFSSFESFHELSWAFVFF